MITMQHRKNKRGLQQLSDAQKMEAITKVQKGETKAAVAREFGVPESTLRGWCKKAKLNGHCHSVMNKSLQVVSTMSSVLMTPETMRNEKTGESDFTELKNTNESSELSRSSCSGRSEESGDDELKILSQLRDVLQEVSKKDSCDTFGAMVAAEIRTFSKLDQAKIRKDISDILLRYTEESAIKDFVSVEDLGHEGLKASDFTMESRVTKTCERRTMAYRDCGYSKGSASDEGSTTHPFSDEQEDEDVKPSVVIPEGQRRVLDWINYGHYPQLAAQSPSTNDNKPAQPVVTSSTCDDVVKPIPRVSKPSRKNNQSRAPPQVINNRNVGFYNWCKTNTACEGYSSPVSPISPASSDKIDSYEDEPLALIVPSKRRLSDLEASLKNELNRMYHDRHQAMVNNTHNINSTNNNNNCSSKNNNIVFTFNKIAENGVCNNVSSNNNNSNHIDDSQEHHITITHNNNNNNDTKQTLSVEEALKHGEVFLDWLKACSDPNVTVFQAMQIGTLLKNLRSSLERSQNRR